MNPLRSALERLRGASFEPPAFSPAVERACDVAAGLFMAGVAVVALVTFRDYGVTWDERIHVEYGDRLVAFWTDGIYVDKNQLYPGGFDLAAALFRRAVPIGDYEATHLLGLLVGLLGLVGTWRLGRFLFGAPGGLAAVALLALTPAYYGHMFNNPKDLPFATGYVWAFYFTVRAIDEFPNVTRSTRLWLGLAIGCALSVRVAGLLLFCYLGLAIAAYVGHVAIRWGSFELAYRAAVRLGRAAAVPFALGWCIMVASWPWAMWRPLMRPLTGLAQMSNYAVHDRKMPFAGGVVRAGDAPPEYTLHYMGLKLPELLLLLAVVGLVAGGVVVAMRGVRDTELKRNLALGVLGVAAVFPPAYAAYKGSTLYDGLRHFLFVVPIIAVIAAGALTATIALARAWRPRLAMPAIAAMLVLAGGRQVYAMVDLHPHQYVFFNELAGGLRGAFGRYSTDYYGEAYLEALHELEERLWREDPDAFTSRRWRVGGCFNSSMLNYRTAPVFERTRSGSSADFWVAYTRQGCDFRVEGGQVMFDITRDGVRLVRVRDLRKPTAAATPSPRASGGPS